MGMMVKCDGEKYWWLEAPSAMLVLFTWLLSVSTNKEKLIIFQIVSRWNSFPAVTVRLSPTGAMMQERGPACPW